MRKSMLLAAALSAAALSTAAVPASAVRVGSGVSGGITSIGADFTACAALYFPPGHLFVGEFTAVGEVQGPGTKVGTVRQVVPIVATGSWSYCIPGSYLGATVGEGKFTLVATSATEDYAEVQQCVVNNGSISCH